MSPVCFRPVFDEMDGLWLTEPVSWYSYRRHKLVIQALVILSTSVFLFVRPAGRTDLLVKVQRTPGKGKC
jgi:hypothetical protein